VIASVVLTFVDERTLAPLRNTSLTGSSACVLLSFWCTVSQFQHPSWNANCLLGSTSEPEEVTRWPLWSVPIRMPPTFDPSRHRIRSIAPFCLGFGPARVPGSKYTAAP
jgi:hypothetical protein